jgi:hypothetical protein
MCDDHDDRPAVRRVQGETDSFGCEYILMCQECLDKFRAYQSSEEATTGCCDWCKSHATDLANRRDSDEGTAGPLYRVCGACRKKDNEHHAAELAEMDRETGRDDYLFDDDGRDEHNQGF